MSGPFTYSDRFSPVWSGFNDVSLRPTLIIARDGSGYRPVSISEILGTGSSDTTFITGQLETIRSLLETGVTVKGAVQTSGLAIGATPTVSSVGAVVYSGQSTIPFSSHIKFAGTLTASQQIFVTGVPNKRIQILQMIAASPGGISEFYFAQSGIGSSGAVSASMTVDSSTDVGSVLVLPYSQIGWVETIQPGHHLTICLVPQTNDLSFTFKYILIN